ncbi:TPA: hypothetical protein DEP30_03875 [Candidatus Nomurabacteria bacterium]|nr:MAG: hypothetical protein US00_C0004G0036 [Candidatus Nomurabacteria bacterium GW2011_GWF2_36_126]KKP96364.1 MAG: hypothetical protein US04_C0002G0036 [Candidatus Nomurabacteria bacterium GW2011_GWD2_36_14]KKP99025.1 MAG: hypothetical protein US08_C0004G0036 [Candidatus Nomurabacteria bacterium GW2011_GWF2_36_19]KKQ05191.1 MAG: hypothetical protein US17_C0006G0038 [Candidatus Nomurabacteria bacterium GW2011_GWF1_36_47]KKQ09176.1 MAG: hypothetical protein US21_C0007G0035 [Candidatus Nomurabac
MAIDLKQIGQHQSDIEDLKKRQKLSEIISMGVIVVLFITLLGLVFALGTMMVDTYRSSESSYSNLVNTINQQNNKIDLLLKKSK